MINVGLLTYVSVKDNWVKVSTMSKVKTTKQKRIEIWHQMRYESEKLISEICKEGPSFDDQPVYQRIYNLMRLANEQDGDWLKLVFTYMCFDSIHKNNSTLDSDKIKRIIE